MKYLYLIFAILITVSCDPDEEDRITCYSYINGTDKEVTLEFYNYNGGRLITEIGTYSSDALELITSQCKSKRDVPGPVNFFRFDSIVVKFDNNRKLTYLWRFGQGGDAIFYGDSYQRDGESSNFSYTFTDIDYNNSEPF